MKKLALFFISMFIFQTALFADDDKPIQISQLPVKAQEFIKSHFQKSEVLLAKIDTELLNKSYKVVFSGGESVEFDKNGLWKDVECKQTVVPAAIVPNVIADYVKKNFPKEKILKIDRDSKFYEIELSNKLELKFDKNFKLVDLDN